MTSVSFAPGMPSVSTHASNLGFSFNPFQAARERVASQIQSDLSIIDSGLSGLHGNFEGQSAAKIHLLNAWTDITGKDAFTAPEAFQLGPSEQNMSLQVANSIIDSEVKLGIDQLKLHLGNNLKNADKHTLNDLRNQINSQFSNYFEAPGGESLDFSKDSADDEDEYLLSQQVGFYNPQEVTRMPTVNSTNDTTWNGSKFDEVDGEFYSPVAQARGYVKQDVSQSNDCDPSNEELKSLLQNLARLEPNLYDKLTAGLDAPSKADFAMSQPSHASAQSTITPGRKDGQTGFIVRIPIDLGTMMSLAASSMIAGPGPRMMPGHSTCPCSMMSSHFGRGPTMTAMPLALSTIGQGVTPSNVGFSVGDLMSAVSGVQPSAFGPVPPFPLQGARRGVMRNARVMGPRGYKVLW